MTENTTSPEVKVGQRWTNNDLTDPCTYIDVLEVEENRVRIARFRRTWVRKDRFVKKYTYLHG
ncbi:hypothetical protein ACFVAJ_17645 [Agromyces sp. NPDC057679]|uniref:hypothetical protein n=1 Tax=Agromyces sp. NPDC057679 TaxID=3346207 RepID=UPI00366F1DD0